uniref:Forkhead box H1 n=1 Tax=Strigops habroptila TaxID=2489341 RepID=A0A672TKT2_STRHB
SHPIPSIPSHPTPSSPSRSTPIPPPHPHSHLIHPIPPAPVPAMPPPPPPPPRGSGSGPAAPRCRPPRFRYRRHPKPPYSYLALIALVIRAAPGRRLKLAQIIQEIRSLFPFFGGGYQGWKDSVRHNLSSNPCFAKVLKDPARPKAKGNYWTVDVSRIPAGSLRLQNTAVARGGAAAFPRDLTPFVLRGCPFPPPPASRSSAFSIASLLSDLGKQGTPPPLPSDTPISSLWGSAPIVPPTPWVPPPIGGQTAGPHVCPPAPWGQLPTSYSTAVAPNAVAPPNGPPVLALRWGVLPPHPPAPPRSPQSPEGGAQPMPPNKSIFDVWLSHPGDTVPPALHG